MKIYDLFYGLPEPALLLIPCFLLYAVLELGFRFGRLQRHEGEKISETVVSYSTGTYTLLSILLAFVVVMAATRYDSRKAQVIEETNAIATSYLRTHFLPSTQRHELGQLLLRYVNLRLDFFNQTKTIQAEEGVLQKTWESQKEFWNYGAGLARQFPRSIPLGLLLHSLNSAIDDQEKVLVTYRDIVPPSIIILLFLTAFMVMGSLGFESGLDLRRHFMFTTTVALLIAANIFVVLDLDRPRHGFIQVKTDALTRLRDSIQSDLSRDTKVSDQDPESSKNSR